MVLVGDVCRNFINRVGNHLTATSFVYVVDPDLLMQMVTTVSHSFFLIRGRQDVATGLHGLS